jgi:hypothetical protein
MKQYIEVPTYADICQWLRDDPRRIIRADVQGEYAHIIKEYLKFLRDNAPASHPESPQPDKDAEQIQFDIEQIIEQHCNQSSREAHASAAEKIYTRIVSAALRSHPTDREVSLSPSDFMAVMSKNLDEKFGPGEPNRYSTEEVEWLLQEYGKVKLSTLLQDREQAAPDREKGNAEQIAQWVIDNRYAKSENDKVSDFEMFHLLVEKIKVVAREKGNDEPGGSALI